MSLSKYTSYVLLATAYIILTKNTFRNIYRRLRRLSLTESKLFLRKYLPVSYHWFYQTSLESQKVWKPFSEFDSHQLENAYLSSDFKTEKIISTDGGRFDVNLLSRKRKAVYWTTASTKVRRCSWFYKSYNDLYFTPFEEHIAEILESEYQNAYETSGWHQVANLPNGDSIAFNGPDNIILLPSQKYPRQRLIKRGIDDEFEITDNEAAQIDHLIFAVHGIGGICDLKLRTIEEVVNIFREKVLELLKKNKPSDQNVKTKRVEVLPINWHKALHNKISKTDKNLHSITLKSLPLLRNFTNDTLVDILLYTSTIYSQDGDDDGEESSVRFSTRVPFTQIILTAVTSELNRVYDKFKKRNPKFDGEISLLGHSLGSVIIFDLLCYQQPQLNIEPKSTFTELGLFWFNRGSNRINLLSPSGSKQELECPQLKFHPIVFFAIGSPIGLFLTIRGIDKLGTEFSFPTCKHFLNIFHPCDPIAYRIEPLVNHELENTQPSLIPHCGKWYLNIEIKDILIRIGKNVKSTVLNYFKTQFLSLVNTAYLNVHNCEARDVNGNILGEENRNIYNHQNSGNLNQGRRIDFSLQESSMKCLNEYVWAVTSHACYWESTDVIQLILNELYPNT